jgi:hypothetical protein
MKQKKWLWGSAHTHSEWSDGLDSVAELSMFFKRLGMDFRFQTDHCGIKMPEGVYLRKTDVCSNGHLLVPENFAKYMEECRKASDSEHKVIPGIELDLDYGSFELNARNHYNHILVYGFNSAGQILPEGWFRDKDFFRVMRDLKELGLTTHLAHTNGGDFLPWQELADTPFNGVQIDAYMPNPTPPLECGTLKCGFWDRWLCSGRRVSIATGCDCHQADNAGFSMRNALATAEFSEAAIFKSFKEGKSYISATWHPNLYKECHLEERGTYWWRLAQAIDRKKGLLQLTELRSRMFKNDYGRVRTEDYPILSFESEGKTMGDTLKVHPGSLAKLDIGVRMHVPVEFVDVIQDGVLMRRLLSKSGELHETVELKIAKSRSYVRLQGKGSDADGNTEYLISNPIYFESLKKPQTDEPEIAGVTVAGSKERKYNR